MRRGHRRVIMKASSSSYDNLEASNEAKEILAKYGLGAAATTKMTKEDLMSLNITLVDSAKVLAWAEEEKQREISEKQREIEREREEKQREIEREREERQRERDKKRREDEARTRELAKLKKASERDANKKMIQIISSPTKCMTFTLFDEIDYKGMLQTMRFFFLREVKPIYDISDTINIEKDAFSWEELKSGAMYVPERASDTNLELLKDIIIYLSKSKREVTKSRMPQRSSSQQ